MWVWQLQEPFCNNYEPVWNLISIQEIYSVGTNKKVISMNYGSSTSSWKPWRWVRLDLILTMRDIYISSNLNTFTKFTSSSKSTEFKDILPWNIPQIIMETAPISMRIVVNYAMKWGITIWAWQKVIGNWKSNMIMISQWRESHCRTSTSIKRNK